MHFFFPLEGMLTVSLSVKSDIITDDNIKHLVYSKIPITPTKYIFIIQLKYVVYKYIY